MQKLMLKIQFSKHITQKRALVLLGIFIALLVVSSFSLVVVARAKKISLDADKNQHVTIPPTAPYVPDELIVKFREGYIPYVLEKEIAIRNEKKEHLIGRRVQKIDDLATKVVGDVTPEEKKALIEYQLKQAGVESFEREFITEDSQLDAFYIFTLKKGSSITKAQEELSSVDFLESTEPNFISKIFKTPNDTNYPAMGWPAKISAPSAWDTTIGSASIIAAVLDTGVDLSHPDLMSHIITGYDFANNDGNPQDDVGHGTHVAGTIGAVGDNGQGVVGVNWNVRIMPLKVCSATDCQEVDIARAIAYASDNGAKVINMSLGTPAPHSQPCSAGSNYQSAISYAVSKGVSVFVSAGNDNRDVVIVSPASCQGVITVGASTSSDTRASFSNFGGKVSIAAPGVSILATFLRGKSVDASCGDSNFGTSTDGVGYCSGTSMASPIAAGAGALLLSVNPSLNPSQIKDCLVNNADTITTDRVIGPRLNILKAIQNCSTGTSLPTATPTVAGSPGTSVSPSPETTISPSPSTTEATPTLTPTPSLIIVGSPTPTPTPIVYYSCHYDPVCAAGNPNAIQICPLVCEEL